MEVTRRHRRPLHAHASPLLQQVLTALLGQADLVRWPVDVCNVSKADAPLERRCPEVNCVIGASVAHGHGLKAKPWLPNRVCAERHSNNTHSSWDQPDGSKMLPVFGLSSFLWQCRE